MLIIGWITTVIALVTVGWRAILDVRCWEDRPSWFRSAEALARLWPQS